MLAQLASLGMTLGGTLFGMNQAEGAAERAQAAAMQAADQQANGLENAIGERRSGLKTTLSYLEPYQKFGLAGQGMLSDALGINGQEAQQRYYSNFQNDPGYLATLRAGTDAVEQSSVGSGLLRSGGTLKALQEYGGRMMQSQFSDRLNRLAGVGAQGQQAAGAMAGFNNSSSSDVSGYLRDIGIARAGGIINASNADQRGTQNQLGMLGFGMGQARSGINDLIGQLGFG